MTRYSYSDIKQSAKDQMKGHFGEVFLALAVLPMLLGMANSAVAMAFGDAQMVGFVAQIFVTVLIQYITIMLVLKISKGNFQTLFMNLFGNRKGYLNMLIYTLIITVITALPMFLYLDYIIEVTDYFATLPVNYIPTENEIQNILTDFLPNASILIASGVLIFISFILGVKLYFTPYLIVDKKMKAIDAMKLSWQYTNGNFFRVLFFPLSFILWFLLIFVTCGLILIYVIPYTTLAFGMFYNAILRENDNYVVPEFKKEISEKEDPLEEKKSEDPFDDYYE